MAIRVVVVDDEAVIGYAMAQVLGMEPDIEVVGVGTNGREAVQLVHETMPDVLLVDLKMPIMDGLEAIRRIKQEQPKVEVCILTVMEDDAHLFEALRLGAHGYLLKDATPAEVVQAIRRVAQGEAAIPPRLATRLLAEFQRLSQQRKELQRLFSELTHREIEILKLIAEGKTNKEIADQLFLSEKTIKNHVSNILFKLEVNSRTEAAILAVQSGLV